MRRPRWPGSSASAFRHGQEDGCRDGRGQYQRRTGCGAADRRFLQDGRHPFPRSTGKFDSRRGGTRSAGRLSPRLFNLVRYGKNQTFPGNLPAEEHAAEVASRPTTCSSRGGQSRSERTFAAAHHQTPRSISIRSPMNMPRRSTAVRSRISVCGANRGWLQQDEEEHYYVYAQTMDGRTQYGLAMCCRSYRNGAIKKHELTRPEQGGGSHEARAASGPTSNRPSSPIPTTPRSTRWSRAW